jgi:outer membrane putative beta-barrel porin/alpha-amylase
MMFTRALAAAAMLLAAAGVCGAQDAIEPDRPDVTNGAHIVGTGLLQIEFGGLFTHTQPAQSAFGSPFMARLGVFEWLEARISTDGLLTQTDENGRATGIGNTQVGAKLRLWADASGVSVLSILPTINLPTASAEKGLGSGAADYTIAVLTGTDFGRHAHVDVNYGVGAIGTGGDHPRFVQHLLSVSASDAVTDSWNPYIEVFWFSRQDIAGQSLTSVDGGAIYQIGTRYAVDGGVQIGATANAPRLAVFGGFSMIVGDVLGRHRADARQRRK